MTARIEEGPGWRLILSDCLDPVDGLASLADRSVEHVITDPPYEAEAHTLQRRIFNGGADRGGGIKSAPLTFVALDEATRDGLAREARRIAARWVLVFCQAEAVGAWRASFTAADLPWKRACVWLKPNGQPQMTGDRPGMGYESIACAHGPGRSRWNAGGKHGVYTFAVKRLRAAREQLRIPLACEPVGRQATLLDSPPSPRNSPLVVDREP